MNANKKKIIAIIIIFFAISFALEFFIILPSLDEIKKINDDIQKERENLEMKFQQGQLLKKVMSDYKSVESRKNELEVIFVEKGRELEFITELENIAQKYNLEPEFMKLKGDEAQNEVVSHMLLNISFEGDFMQTLHFLSDMEKLPYYFNISKISLKTINEQKVVASDIVGTAHILDK